MDKRPESRPEADQARELLQSVADSGGRDTPTSALRGFAASPPRPETERSVPSVPPGFGPPQQSQPGAAGPHEGQGTPGFASAAVPGAAGAPGAAGQGGPGTQGFGPAGPGGNAAGSSALTGPMNPRPAPGRKKTRVLLVAAAVTVVLAVAGTTVALLRDSDGTEQGTRTDAAASEPGPADAGSNAPRPTRQGDEKGKAPSGEPGEKEPESSGRPATSAPAKSSGGTTGDTTGGTSGGGTSGGTTGGSGTGVTAGGGSTTPAPVCHAIGGGKYNCQVWKTAASRTASGTKAGILNAGTNYFYCQQNLGRRETYGQWTNVWWAKTDDDSGNTNVWVSDVYIKGGDNDGPVPGLPVC